DGGRVYGRRTRRRGAAQGAEAGAGGDGGGVWRDDPAVAGTAGAGAAIEEICGDAGGRDSNLGRADGRGRGGVEGAADRVAAGEARSERADTGGGGRAVDEPAAGVVDRPGGKGRNGGDSRRDEFDREEAEGG